ncbi:MAG TPA: MgtC/SapB family protein [Armatimonadota bacterium]|nr:MgtC/SapB family protein [Armatimonadota bacterium]
MDPLFVLLKLMGAVICGGIVGWQREAHDRPAGLRTHVLVCLGATVYTLASLSFSGPTSDPGRVAAQVATGMGFLGAGTIIRHGNTVRGLTTAASLWAVAAIGLCVGIGGEAMWVAGMATVMVLLTLTALRRVEVAVLARARVAHLTLTMAEGARGVASIRRALAERGAELESIEMTEVGPGEVQAMQLRVVLPHGCDMATLGPELAELEGFVSVRCE